MAPMLGAVQLAAAWARAVQAEASKQATPIVAADLSRPRRSFQTSDAYEEGDRVIHPSFGEGVVQRGWTTVSRSRRR